MVAQIEFRTGDADPGAHLVCGMEHRRGHAEDPALMFAVVDGIPRPPDLLQLPPQRLRRGDRRRSERLSSRSCFGSGRKARITFPTPVQ